VFNLDLHVLKIKQADIELYVTVMKALELLRYAKIDYWSETNPEGYQRPLLERRVAQATNYLLFEDKVFPGSILANIRGEVEFFPTCKIDGFGEYGILRIPARSLPFWVIDGQHRIAAIAWASRENPAYENYPVPVTLLTLKDRYSEMRIFYIVNNRQKRISTSLAQQHLRLAISKLGVEEIRKYETKRKVMAAASLNIVDFLRKDPESPWYEKILLPNERRKANRIISQTSFADSIGILLGKLPPEDFDINKIEENSERIALLLKNYWNALRDLFPEAFELPQDYTIQKTLGCYVFHTIFPHVYILCKEKKDFSKNMMKKILIKMFENFSKATGIKVTSDFWNRWSGNPLATGTGMKTVRKLANLFIDCIPLKV